ncbi:MAG: hypothetical protein NVS3B10_25050 [Polyangiales bacterium]
MWFPMTPMTLADAEGSPSALRFEAIVAAPPELVFEVWTGDDLVVTLPDLRAIEWTSSPPRGVGSTRIVRLQPFAVKERFLAWEPARRVTFTMEAISLPVLGAMMEDFRLEPVRPHHTHVRYTVHYVPRARLGPVSAVARRWLAATFGDALATIATVATARAQHRTAR